MELTIPPQVSSQARVDFETIVGDPGYACLGARSALRRDGCDVHVYGPMDDADTTARLAHDLGEFAARELDATRLVAFVAIFLEPAAETELEFEARLWSQLTSLSIADAAPWSPDASDDPENAGFAFSYASTPYFVIGMHAESSRIARRMSWPALVFNPHAQFDRLRESGKYDSLKTAIRGRDIKVQGEINPSLADRGERSEARQYSGRAAEENWGCPFHRPPE